MDCMQLITHPDSDNMYNFINTKLSNVNHLTQLNSFLTPAMMGNFRRSESQIELITESPIIPTPTQKPQDNVDEVVVPSVKNNNRSSYFSSSSSSTILTRIHAGYFRISLSLCSQALLWKVLSKQINQDSHAFPATVFILLWSIALLTVLSLSVLYMLRCFYHFKMVKYEFLHHIGVNYLFVPLISWLFLLQSASFIPPHSVYYLALWWIFVIPIVVLDLKIYGQWFTKGKRFNLSMVANPTSQLSVIGNLVGAHAAAQMEWEESAMCLFSLGMVHYLVLFVTLYQRLLGSHQLPISLRPVFFLFIAAPSLASLSWYSIVGKFDMLSKMLFYVSLFLFASLVVRPNLFRKSMKKFNVAWWAYSFPLTVLALASMKYTQEVKCTVSYVLMLVLSVAVSLGLLVFTALKTGLFFPESDLIYSTKPHPHGTCESQTA